VRPSGIAESQAESNGRQDCLECCLAEIRDIILQSLPYGSVFNMKLASRISATTWLSVSLWLSRFNDDFEYGAIFEARNI
jgi:hypothetical protein